MPTSKGVVSRVPTFKSQEEETAFWESHSPLDYPEHWKEVKQVKVQQPLGHILGVRLEAKVIDELAAIAQRKGIGPSTLARMWLMERLDQERQEQAPGKQSAEEPAFPAPARRR